MRDVWLMQKDVLIYYNINFIKMMSFDQNYDLLLFANKL